MKLKRAVLQFLCLLVLFSQQVAVTHAVWHASDDGFSHHDRQADGRPTPSTPAGIASLCEFDAVLGQLLAAGPSPESRHCSFDTMSPPQPLIAAALGSTSPYRAPARGPPHFL